MKKIYIFLLIITLLGCTNNEETTALRQEIDQLNIKVKELEQEKIKLKVDYELISNELLEINNSKEDKSDLERFFNIGEYIVSDYIVNETEGTTHKSWDKIPETIKLISYVSEGKLTFKLSGINTMNNTDQYYTYIEKREAYKMYEEYDVLGSQFHFWGVDGPGVSESIILTPSRDNLNIRVNLRNSTKDKKYKYSASFTMKLK